MDFIRDGNLERIKEILLEKDDNNNPLLIKKKFGQYKETALHLAVKYGHEEIVKLLLENGADIHATDFHSRTALHTAADENEGINIITLILKCHGVKVNARDSYGNTPVKLAAEKGSSDAVRLLMENGADVTIADFGGNTTLHVTAKKGHIRVLELLLKKLANTGDIGKQNKDRNTPLHLAVERQSKQCVAMLLNSGATSTTAVKNELDQTAAELAEDHGDKEIIALLNDPKKANELFQDKPKPAKTTPVQLGKGCSVEEDSTSSKESDAQLTSLPSPKNQTGSFVTPTDWSKLPKHIRPDSKDVYKMLSRPRGIALIINNESFHPDTYEKMVKLAVREGSERDVKALETLLEELHFTVKTERNKERQEILEILDHISHGVDHRAYDCFVLWLLSHGEDGHIYGADGETVSIETVRDFFSNARCPTLKGKPKLIFIQACRGSQEEKGVVADSPTSVNEQPTANANNDKITIADHADILMAYSTVSGYLSYRSEYDGSRFVQCIVEVFREFAGHEDLLSMHSMVNKKMSEMGNKYSKQVSAPTTTLTRKLYFWPGL